MPSKASERRYDAEPVTGTAAEQVWRALVFHCTWIVARKFHFQVFCYLDSAGKGTVLRDKAAKCVPATAFVVADHLAQLIITDGIPREGALPEDDSRRIIAFNLAVWRLHATTFAPYYDWAQHQRFEPFPKADEAGWMQLAMSEEHSSLPALLDLCTYFCLWTEAANVKHMPEAMWFLFWAMRHSPHYNQLHSSISGVKHRDGHVSQMFPQLWARSREGRKEPTDWQYTLLQLRELRIAVRNDVLTSERFAEVEELVRKDETPDRQRPFNLRLKDDKRPFPDTSLDPITAADGHSVRTPEFNPLRHLLANTDSPALGSKPNSSVNTAVLRDLVYIGDGGLFTERIITPIFQALAFELATKGGNGCEPALRITYDDANESFVLPTNVTEILRILHCQGRPDEVFLKLWQPDIAQQVGVSLEPPRSFYSDMRAIYGGTDKAPNSGVFKKTFQERRTWLQLFRAYFRVLAFHVLWFHLLLGLAFADNNDFEFQGRWWVPMSGAALTHALLSLAYFWSGLFVKSHIPAPPAASHDIRRRVQSSNIIHYVTWCCCLCWCGVGYRERDLTASEKPLSKRLWTVPKVNKKSKLFKQGVMMLVFIALFGALLFVFVAQFSWFPWPDDEDENVEDRLLINGDRPLVFFRDIAWPAVAAIYGVVVLVLSAVLVQRDGYVITASSLRAMFARMVGKCTGSGGTGNDTLAGGAFVAKVPPRYGYGQLLRNMLFWAIVLALKFVLDYFLIMRTLPDPIRGLLNASWLETCDADLEIGNTGIPCVENMVLVVALCFPIFLVTVFDTGILYQIGVFLYGCANGLFVQKLGQVVTWNDLIKLFEKGVNSFGRRMLSVRALDRWDDPRHVRHYYQSEIARGNEASGGELPHERSIAGEGTAPLDADNDWRSQEYARWTPFAHVWDSIITELRISDLISNEESGNLRFMAVHFLKDQPYELKPLILPICFFAGKVQQALDNGSVDAVGLGVLADAVNLFLVLLHKIGLIDTNVFTNFRKREPGTGISLLNQPQNHYHTDVRGKMIKALSAFVTALTELIPKNDHPAANVQKTQQVAVDSFVEMLRNLEIELAYCKARWGIEHPAADQLANVGEILRGSMAGLVVKTPDSGGADSTYSVRPGSAFQRMLGKLSAQKEHMQGLDLEDRTEIQDLRNISQALKAAISLTDQQSEPRNDEAKRVLKFYMSSLLNSHMPRPLDYALMRSLTTLVPHYSEDVIYPLDANEVKERTGKDATPGKITSLVQRMKGMEISTLDFLRIQFEDEWANFVERLVENWRGALKNSAGDVVDFDKVDPAAITVRDFLLSNEHGLFSREPDARMDLMMWASERGQLLARTTRGMMMYQQALELFEPLESPDPRNKLDPRFYEGKFRHIVAAQVYGEKAADGKGENKWIAKSIDLLMKRYPTFRVAYMDKVKDHPMAGAHGVTHSVLLRWNEEDEAPEEVYRVRLPWQTEDKRGVVLGEGKPENQNAAMIFCFGECVQTVDMNQENRLAEAYKMRNLLTEFEPNRERVVGFSNMSAGVFRHDVVVNAAREPIVALVGFREWIFSGKAGALGAFAAGAEFAFGTIVQRTMAEPGGARFHYGHPDVWNKLFTMTRGGVSKATRAFHISEDVFGGYNAIFRGAIVKYKEYISVGKGRDVGFDQINGFEAKVSGGNGEQSISRDVYRLGSRLGWFRLMSWYHSGIGFFVNSTLTMASVYLAVWLIFVFALAGALTVRSGDTDTRVNDSQLINSINTVQVFQLGLLSVIPYWAELCLETGFLNGSMDILGQMVSGSLLFFIFRQQTSAFYFTQIAYYGGAKYIATGRGFALTHTPYVSTFSNFGRSHIYFGFQLGMLAIMLAFVGVRDYFLSTWGTWLVSISLTFAPLWFNPHTFIPDVAWADFKAWRNWMLGSQDPSTGESWIKWNRGQLEKPRNVGGKQTDHMYNRLGGVLMQFFNLVIFIALVERIVRPRCLEVGADGGCDREESRRPKVLGAVLFELAIAIVIAMLIVQRIARAWGAQLRRFVSIAAFVLFAVMFVLWLRVFGDDASSGFRDIVLLGFANFTLGIIIVQLTLFIAPYNELGVIIVNAGYYAADTVIGLVTFFFVFLLSIVPLVDSIQALLLFNKDVLQASRAGRQLSDFRTQTGSAGAAAIFGAPAARRGGGGGGDSGSVTTAAAGAGATTGVQPVGAIAPIPAPAADPQTILPPQRFTDATMTYGTNLAASVMGGMRSAFGAGQTGSSSRRRRPFAADPAAAARYPDPRDGQDPAATASPMRYGIGRGEPGTAQDDQDAGTGTRPHRPSDLSALM